MSIREQSVFIVGGSSGIGLSTAKLALNEGANVIIGSRSTDKLEVAKIGLEGNLRTVVVDVTMDDSVSTVCNSLGPFDHVVCTAPGATVGAVKELDINSAQEGMRSFGVVFVSPNTPISIPMVA